MNIQTNTVVIGAGPGGYVAAIRAAQLGQKVTIVEKQHVGGVCLNVGCIPSKALITAGHRYQEAKQSAFLGVNTKEVTLDFAKTQQWKDKEVVGMLTAGIEALLKKNKVQLIEGTAIFKSANQLTVGDKTITFQQAIIATGSSPIEIPTLPFGERMINSTGGLNLKEVPKSLMVIGGGYIGCELACAYANLGSKVTIVEGSSSLLPMFETDIQRLLTDSLQKKGITVLTNAKAKGATVKGDTVTVTTEVNGKDTVHTSDYVMVTVGRKPNTAHLGLEKIGIHLEKSGLIPVNEKYQTRLPHIYAIGDVVEGLALAHKASYDGKVAAEVIAGKKVVRDYKAIPSICFTDPEVATVGHTKGTATQSGLDVEVAMFPLGANGRALTLHATEGFIRVVYLKKTEVIVGAQIVGVGASELIAELTLAIETYLTLEDIALVIHGHPTLSEVVAEVTEVGLGLPIHV